jgi:hypothetical protein
MRERRAAKREEKTRRNMVRRTCEECGHSWVLPGELAKAGRDAALGSILSGNVASGNVAAGAMLAQRAVDFERCVACGSVRYYREEPLEAEGVGEEGHE